MSASAGAAHEGGEGQRRSRTLVGGIAIGLWSTLATLTAFTG